MQKNIALIRVHKRRPIQATRKLVLSLDNQIIINIILLMLCKFLFSVVYRVVFCKFEVPALRLHSASIDILLICCDARKRFCFSTLSVRV